MRARYTRWLCALSAVAVLSGCNDGTATAPQGHVRFVNLISDPAKQPVDAFLDNEPFGSSMPFGSSSPFVLPPPLTALYSPEFATEHTLVLTKSSDQNVVVGVYTFELLADEYRTVYATGSGGFVLRETVDDNTPPAPGMIRVRLVNLSETSGALDLFLTTQDADLTAATPMATDVSMLASSTYFSMPPGRWHIRAVKSGVTVDARAANVVVSLPDQVWPAGGRTIVIADVHSGAPAITSRAVVLTDQ